MGEILQRPNPPDQITTDAEWADSTRLNIPENSVGNLLVNFVAYKADDLSLKAVWTTSRIYVRAGLAFPTVEPGLFNMSKKDVLAALWDIDIAVDGTDLVVRVKGDAGFTVYWAINGIIFENLHDF